MLALASCGPRGPWASPREYAAVRQDDDQAERLELLHQKAAGADASAAREFAAALRVALTPGGLAGRRDSIGESLPVERLLADAQSALDRAMQNAPGSEADLLLDKGQLLMTVKRWGPARGALLSSIERRPSQAAFLAVVGLGEPALLPEPARFAMLCEQTASVTSSTPADASGDGWRAYLDFVRAYVEYCAKESPDGNRMLYGDAAKVPGGAHVPARYRTIYGCWIDRARCLGPARKRRLPADFCEKELTRCVQVGAR
jgi:hypothetical protein